MNDQTYASMPQGARLALTRDALRAAGLSDVIERVSPLQVFEPEWDRLQAARAIEALAKHVEAMAHQLSDAEYVFDSDLSDEDLLDIARSLDRVARMMEG